MFAQLDCQHQQPASLDCCTLRNASGYQRHHHHHHVSSGGPISSVVSGRLQLFKTTQQLLLQQSQTDRSLATDAAATGALDAYVTLFIRH